MPTNNQQHDSTPDHPNEPTQTDIYRPQKTEVLYSTLLDETPIAKKTESTIESNTDSKHSSTNQIIFDTADLNPPSPTLVQVTGLEKPPLSSLTNEETLIKTPKSESFTDKNILATSHQLLPSDDHLAYDSNAMGRMIEYLQVATKQWDFSINWQRTLVPKSGLLNQFKKKTELLDLDLACLLCNRYGEVIERVWFKNVRDRAESVRHHGDELLGTASLNVDETHNNAVATNDTLTVMTATGLSNDRQMNQERISLYFPRLPPHVYHVIFVVSSFQKQALAKAKNGICQLTDDEGNIITELSLATLEDNCFAVRVATLTRASDSWRYHADMTKLNVQGIEAIEKEISEALVRTAK